MNRVRPQADAPPGTLLRLPHRSAVLAGNPWDDPVARELCVYLPHGYREEGEPYTALWDLAAFTNSGPGHLNWRNHGENLVARLDRLIHTGAMPPVVVALPDCYTSLGGNQYLNSPAVGRYADYLVDELVPLLARQVNVRRGREGRGLFGKSSGAYGALYHAIHHPDTWGGVAAHAPDCGFEWVYRTGFPTAARVIAGHGGDPLRFLREFWRMRAPGADEFHALLTIAMAASYDPDPGEPTRIRLPFDLETCAIDPARWRRWLAFDPLNMAESGSEALRRMSLLYLDVGSRDQYHIQYGVRSLARRLENWGVSHHFEEFDGTHSGLDWRLDTSLPLLASALAGEPGTATTESVN